MVSRGSVKQSQYERELLCSDAPGCALTVSWIDIGDSNLLINESQYNL
jgi:hypothetical protein